MKNKQFNHHFEKGKSAHMKITHLKIGKKPCLLKICTLRVRVGACAISLEDATEYNIFVDRIRRCLLEKYIPTDKEDVKANTVISKYEALCAKYLNPHDTGCTFIKSKGGKAFVLTPQMLKDWATEIVHGTLMLSMQESAPSSLPGGW
ncbi:hypothetical protein GGF50DRAFT_92904 [Schizophyllum commune]